MTIGLSSRTFTLGATFVLLSGLVGCASFDNQPKLMADVSPSSDEPAQPAASIDTYTVEVRWDSGKSEAMQHPLTGQLCVQEALEQAGALKRFQRFDVELYRPLPAGRWHMMAVEYDRVSKQVAPERNYAILPGDRLAVIEDPSTLIDDAAEVVLKPLGINFGKKDFRQRVAERYRVGD